MTTAGTAGAYYAHPFDEAAVLNVLAGGRPYLSPADRQEAILRLARRGWSSREIAERVHCTVRTVDRAKARAR